MKIRLSILKPVLFAALFFTCKVPIKPTTENAAGPIPVLPNPSPATLTPEESMKTMRLPEGYRLELVASEPMIKEPVAIAWDGNGRLFVAEMDTYMQDVNGTGKDDAVSRIMLLEDTNGDGKMDKSSVYVDKLVLPRMILPLDGRLLVNETNTNYIWSYRDSNGDGVADEKKLVYKDDKKDTRNLEHQKSGLNWNIDNWIYVARDAVRYKWVDDAIKIDSMKLMNGGYGQWGLTHDNYGRLFFSNAGGEVPAHGFQQNPAYGNFDIKDQITEEFQATWPILATPDVQGGAKRMRADSTLNHFTASNGQSIFRGDRLPKDMHGDLFICEPVGRLIRRAKVSNQDGKIFLKNAYDRREFLASTDMNFRPVNTATGPDGLLYVVDMYRGIIQESNWTKEGSYLRPQIKRLGLDKNTSRGRIYRIVHESYKPRTEKPKMLQESAQQLVGHLDHPNGWWRDNAQKLLILKKDKSVVPALKEMALGQQSFFAKSFGKEPNHLPQIHALWTLEGLGEADKNTVSLALQDKHPQVRKAAVWVAENYLKKGDTEMLEKVTALKNDPSADVRIQLGLSMRTLPIPKAKETITELITASTKNEFLFESYKRFEQVKAAEAERKKNNMALSAADKSLVNNGAVIFKQLCAACHGADGKGLSSNVAPPLASSKRVTGDKALVTRILLHGLTGPIEGKTYPDVMPAMGNNSDEWVASVLSYVRNDLGNKAPVIRAEEVKKIREESGKREKAWTLPELEKFSPQAAVK